MRVMRVSPNDRVLTGAGRQQSLASRWFSSVHLLLMSQDPVYTPESSVHIITSQGNRSKMDQGGGLLVLRGKLAAREKMSELL